MTTEIESAAAASTGPSTPKKGGKAKGEKKTTKAKAKPTHPKTSDMVNAAIKNLKERGGSSLQAIKKYIGANYKVDAEKLAPFIRKYLKSAVTTGSLVQTKGKGASGSFKLPAAGEKSSGSSSAGAKKKPAAKSASKPAAAKTSATKAKKAKSAKAAVAKKAPAVKKSATSSPKKAAVKEKPEKASAPSKAKKTKKAPTKKPKAPKPKKVSAAKPKAKKAAPKKK